MRKPTWLYAVNCVLPDLDWGQSEPVYPEWAIQKYGIKRVKRMGEIAFKGGGVDNSHRISTPLDFRDLLIKMAETASSK